MDERTCPACRAVNDADARYCDQCGQRLAAAAPNDDLSACPACGGKVVDDPTGASCSDCGLRFGPPAVAGPEEDAPAPAPAAAAPAKTVPCPLCGASTLDDAPQCASCSLWFDPPRGPQPCPRCGQPAGPDDCACGAILTLDGLLKFIEPSVRFVCLKCKSPYARLPNPLSPRCPDCGGRLESADRLKAYAKGLRP